MPNHLLLKSSLYLPPGWFQENDLYARKICRQVQYISNLLWKRWIKENLPQLQQRQKWIQKKLIFFIADIVLLVDCSAPRRSWITARVASLIPDDDRSRLKLHQVLYAGMSQSYVFFRRRQAFNFCSWTCGHATNCYELTRYKGSAGNLWLRTDKAKLINVCIVLNHEIIVRTFEYICNYYGNIVIIRGRKVLVRMRRLYAEVYTVCVGG